MSTATFTVKREDERRKALTAFAASIFIHLLIIVFVAWPFLSRTAVRSSSRGAACQLTLVAPRKAPPGRSRLRRNRESQRVDRPPEIDVSRTRIRAPSRCRPRRSRFRLRRARKSRPSVLKKEYLAGPLAPVTLRQLPRVSKLY
jgi:hypothetical protein